MLVSPSRSSARPQEVRAGLLQSVRRQSCRQGGTRYTRKASHGVREYVSAMIETQRGAAQGARNEAGQTWTTAATHGSTRTAPLPHRSTCLPYTGLPAPSRHKRCRHLACNPSRNPSLTFFAVIHGNVASLSTRLSCGRCSERLPDSGASQYRLGLYRGGSCVQSDSRETRTIPLALGSIGPSRR